MSWRDTFRWSMGPHEQAAQDALDRADREASRAAKRGEPHASPDELEAMNRAVLDAREQDHRKRPTYAGQQAQVRSLDDAELFAAEAHVGRRMGHLWPGGIRAEAFDQHRLVLREFSRRGLEPPFGNYLERHEDEAQR